MCVSFLPLPTLPHLPVLSLSISPVVLLLSTPLTSTNTSPAAFRPLWQTRNSWLRPPRPASSPEHHHTATVAQCTAPSHTCRDNQHLYNNTGPVSLMTEGRICLHNWTLIRTSWDFLSNFLFSLLTYSLSTCLLYLIFADSSPFTTSTNALLNLLTTSSIANKL